MPRVMQLQATVLPQQRRFLESVARMKAYIGGLGGGKTVAGCLNVALQRANSRGMIVAPTYKMLRDATYATFREYLRSVILDEARALFTARLANGVQCLFRSADEPETLRGPNLDWLWIDEGRGCSRDAYHICLGRVRRGDCNFWVTSTPGGYDWMWECFVRDKTDYKELIQCSTSDNHFLPKTYLETLTATYPSRMALSELGGQFIIPGDTRIDPAWIRYVDLPCGVESITIGVDIGIKQKEDSDYTAFVALGRESSGDLVVVAAERFRASFHEIGERLIRFAAKLDNPPIHVEEVGAQTWLIDELQRATKLDVRGMSPGGKDKVQRFAPLEARFERGNVKIMRSIPRWFADELVMFPRGEHDDVVDALVYAFMGVESDARVTVLW